MEKVLEEMAKARVFCSRESVPNAVDALYEFGAIHVTRSRAAQPDVPLPSFDRIATALISLRAMEKTLGLRHSAEAPAELIEPAEKLLEEAERFDADFQRVYEAEKKISELKAQSSALHQRLRDLEPFLFLRVSPVLFESQSRASLMYFKLAAGEKEFSTAAKKLGCNAAFVRAGSNAYCLVAVDGRKASDAERKLSRLGARLSVPRTGASSFFEEHAAVQQQVSEISAQQKHALSFIQEFRARHAARISELRAQLEEHAKKAELPNKFAKSDFVEVIEGWVPAKRFPEMEKMLLFALAEKAIVEKAGTGEEPPVLLDNPPLLRRFEFLIRFFSLPKPGELDPTMVIALTFPLFFGMILGDIGYGLLTVLLALGIYTRVRGDFARDLSGMLFLSGVVTVVFGIIYGEFFGGEEMLGTHLTPLIHRGAHGIELLIGVVLLVAIAHITLGLLISAYLNFLHGHSKHAYAKLSWIALEFSLVAAAGSLVVPDIFPPQYSLAYTGLAVASIAGLYYFEGIIALVEIPAIIANTFSYLRIMALGLSGVILAQVINRVPVEDSFEKLVEAVSRGGDALAVSVALASLLFFSAILVLGHAGALVLGVFESGLQTLRLHYVEFFSKFYRGGGLPFLPLRKTR